MKHIKSTETIAQELGYNGTEVQYAAVTGCLSGKGRVDCKSDRSLERHSGR